MKKFFLPLSNLFAKLKSLVKVKKVRLSLKLSKKKIIGMILTLALITSIVIFLFGIRSGQFVYTPNTYKTAVNQLSESQTAKSTLEAQIQELGVQLDQKEQEIADAQNVSDEQAQVDALNSEISSLSSQIDAKSGEIYSAKIAHYDYVAAAKIRARGQAAIDLYAPSNPIVVDPNFDANYAAAEANYNAKLAENDSLVSQKSAKESERDAIMAKINGVDAIVQSLSAEKLSIENEIVNKKDELTELLLTLESLESNVKKEKHWTQKLNEMLTN